MCSFHGGKAPQVQAAARQRIETERAERAVHTLGLPVEIDPHDALLQEVWRTAGHVTWLAEVVSQLEEEALTHGVSKTVTEPDGGRRIEVTAGINVWVQLYQKERDHLRRVCAESIRAGIDERRVRIVEAQAEQLVVVMRAALSAMIDRARERTGDDGLARDLTEFLPAAIRQAIESSGVIDTTADEA